MKVPHLQLEADTLTRLITEFVTRDGTDYGEHETSLADKIAQVRKQLARGDIFIDFDEESESCNIVPKA